MKKKYNKTLFVDMDGVIADFEGEFCERFGYENRDIVDLHKRYPEVDRDIIDEFIQSSNTYQRLIPHFGGILLLNQAKEEGYYVVLLTSRPETAKEVTRVWLESYEVQYNELWFGKNKGLEIQDFNAMYPNRPVFALIDDIPAFFVQLPLGVVGITWEQPWNEGNYPRMRYNEKKMQIEWKPNTVSEYTKWRSK